ncbi:MAG: hypothetical protein GF331_26005, partial [Chitinivibrionales bacterium]|nr:hypothetical protein [Chitinivibrionales bacterium]
MPLVVDSVAPVPLVVDSVVPVPVVVDGSVVELLLVVVDDEPQSLPLLVDDSVLV